MALLVMVSKNIENNSTNHLMFIIVGTDKLSTVNSKNALSKIMEKIIPLENANIVIADSSYHLGNCQPNFGILLISEVIMAFGLVMD